MASPLSAFKFEIILLIIAAIVGYFLYQRFVVPDPAVASPRCTNLQGLPKILCEAGAWGLGDPFNPVNPVIPVSPGYATQDDLNRAYCQRPENYGSSFCQTMIPWYEDTGLRW